MHLGIVSAWNYAWSVLTACAVIGIAIYLIDRKWGAVVYRFAYDFCHKNPMPESESRGFLYNQSTNRGVTVAMFISSAYSLYMVYELGFTMNFVAELIVWLLMPPALIVGFIVGRFVYKFLLRRNDYFDRADEFGAKLENVRVGEVVESVRGKGTSMLSKATTVFSSAPKAPPPAPVPVAKPVATEEPRLSFKEQLNKFKGG